MKSLKGTKTETNILTAFAGESQARNRYTYFASKAKKDGLILVEKIFLETADQEKEHAERLFKFLEGGTLPITWSFPAGIITDTEVNLREAAGGEHEEYTEMYPEFAKVADAEGFPHIAAVMRNIAIAERYHEQRYLELAEMLRKGNMFRREGPTVWRCLNCGCLVRGTEAPELCPACNHPQGYFEALDFSFGRPDWLLK